VKLRAVRAAIGMNEADPPLRRIFDQPLIFVRKLLVDPARDIRTRRGGAASFGLLSQEQVIDVHLMASPVLVALSKDAMASPSERQMTGESASRQTVVW
jgi:hypothetical protein